MQLFLASGFIADRLVLSAFNHINKFFSVQLRIIFFLPFPFTKQAEKAEENSRRGDKQSTNLLFSHLADD